VKLQFAGLAIGFILLSAACSTVGADPSALRVEDRMAENTLRVVNDGDRTAKVRYPYYRGFRENQMFSIRFRDAAREVVNVDGSWEGWWSPLVQWSDSRPLPRKTFAIPAHGYRDFPRDLDLAILRMNSIRPVAGPCEVQFLLDGELSGKVRREVRAASEWQPSPCPRPAKTLPKPPNFK